jgi:hypothetical protein
MLCCLCHLRPATEKPALCEPCYRDLYVQKEFNCDVDFRTHHVSIGIPRLRFPKKRQRILDEANSDGYWALAVRTVEDW